MQRAHNVRNERNVCLIYPALFSSLFTTVTPVFNFQPDRNEELGGGWAVREAARIQRRRREVTTRGPKQEQENRRRNSASGNLVSLPHPKRAAANTHALDADFCGASCQHLFVPQRGARGDGNEPPSTPPGCVSPFDEGPSFGLCSFLVSRTNHGWGRRGGGVAFWRGKRDERTVGLDRTKEVEPRIAQQRRDDAVWGQWGSSTRHSSGDPSEEEPEGYLV